MTSAALAPTAPAATPGPSVVVRVLGWVGVVVLYLMGLWHFVLPTISTFLRSMQNGNPITGAGDFVGLENWVSVLPQLVPTLGLATLSMLPAAVIALVLGLLIATGMPSLARTSVVTRIAVGVLAALFVPLGVGLPQLLSATTRVNTPEAAVLLVLVTLTLAIVPILTVAFATAFAFVRSGRSGVWTAILTVAIGILGALALGLQLFDLPYALTAGGPNGATMTPAQLIFRLGFQMFDFGQASAVSGFLLLVCGALGILVVLGLAAARIRFVVHTGESDGPRRGGIVGLVVAVLALVGAIILVVPVLTGGWGGEAGVDALQVAVNTWIPTALGTLVQLVVAVLGGLAIGWCRPAGRFSLWLLLPLAPWLFVGPMPLLIARYASEAPIGGLNTWGSLIASPALVVAAVAAFAVLAFGLRDQRGFGVLAALGGAAAGAAGILFLVQSQSLLPSLILISDPSLAPAPLTLLRIMGSGGGTGEALTGSLGLLAPIPVLLIVAVLGVLAQLGLRRVTVARD